jgi:hypothetical protein
MRHMIIAAVGLPLAFSFCGGALAVDVGNAKISVPTPPGYCPLDRSLPQDQRLGKALDELLAGQNRLLAFFAECEQFSDWRIGKRQFLDDYVEVQTPLAGMSSEVSGSAIDVVKRSCAEARTQSLDLVEEKALGDRITSVMKTVKQNEVKLLGVVAEEPNACFEALLQKLSIGDGVEKVQIVVYGTSVVKGKFVYHYRFGLYDGQPSVARLLGEEKKYVAAFLAANPQ